MSVELRHPRAFDRELAGRSRSDACCRWTRRRTRADVSVLDVARASGLRVVDVHRLEDGELTTDDAGWAELDRVLDGIVNQQKAATAVGGDW